MLNIKLRRYIHNQRTILQISGYSILVINIFLKYKKRLTDIHIRLDYIIYHSFQLSIKDKVNTTCPFSIPSRSPSWFLSSKWIIWKLSVISGKYSTLLNSIRCPLLWLSVSTGIIFRNGIEECPVMLGLTIVQEGRSRERYWNLN